MYLIVYFLRFYILLKYLQKWNKKRGEKKQWKDKQRVVIILWIEINPGEKNYNDLAFYKTKLAPTYLHLISLSLIYSILKFEWRNWQTANKTFDGY